VFGAVRINTPVPEVGCLRLLPVASFQSLLFLSRLAAHIIVQTSWICSDISASAEMRTSVAFAYLLLLLLAATAHGMIHSSSESYWLFMWGKF
jgi:hypothetical protein